MVWPRAMQMRALVVAVTAAGCAPPTAVALDVSLADGAQPTSLSLSVFDDFKALVRAQPIPRPKLPGRITLDRLAAAAPLRIALVADGKREAAARVAPQPGKTIDVALALSASTRDGDGDGVPDSIDDCPTVADPAQANARGSGPGDACFGIDLGPPADLTTFDLAHVPGLCPVAGATLCEDWRVPFPANTYWSLDTSKPPPNITVSCDGTRSFYGTSALHMHTDPFGATSTYIQSDLGSSNLPSGAFWVRAYVYLPSLNPPQESNLLSLLDYGHNYASWHIAIGDGFVIEFIDELAQTSVMSATPFPKDRWFCLEWQVNQVATAGMSSSRVYIDGNELTDLASSNDTANPIDANRLILSASFSGTLAQPNGTDVWYTQIAVGPARIGCISP